MHFSKIIETKITNIIDSGVNSLSELTEDELCVLVGYHILESDGDFSVYLNDGDYIPLYVAKVLISSNDCKLKEQGLSLLNDKEIFWSRLKGSYLIDDFFIYFSKKMIEKHYSKEIGVKFIKIFDFDVQNKVFYDRFLLDLINYIKSIIILNSRHMWLDFLFENIRESKIIPND